MFFACWRLGCKNTMLQQEKGAAVLFMWRIGLNLLEYGMGCVNYPVSFVFIYQRDA